MKKIYIILVLVFFFDNAHAQNKSFPLPEIDLKNTSGKLINTNTFKNHNGPIIICFWATWCKPCTRELNAISELYDDWIEETNVKVIAISIDDSRNFSKVKPYADGKDWPFDIYIDYNNDLKRALNVNFIPHTFLLSDNNIIWQHSSFFDGDEEILFQEILKL